MEKEANSVNFEIHQRLRMAPASDRILAAVGETGLRKENDLSIFRRLYDIFRANLNSGSGRGSEPPPDRSYSGSRDSRDETRNRSRQEDQHHDTSGQDPELAQYYANLEIPYGSDLKTVKAAWKRLLRKYHPDLHSQDPEKRQVAEELTQALNHAYASLKQRLAA